MSDFIHFMQSVRPTKSFIQGAAWFCLFAGVLMGCAAALVVPKIPLAGRLGIVAGILIIFSIMLAVVQDEM